jgi:nicotinate (nicotinamide) nucleotide adenylyltransferase
MKMKIGVFGGSFNPPHLFHKKIVDYLLDNKYVDKIIIVPTGDSYKKRNLTTFINRYNMLNIMFTDNRVTISKLGNEGYDYTYLYMDYYQDLYKDAELFFICGEDNIKDVETWKNAKHLTSNYKFLVISRNNLNVDDKEYIVRVNLESNNISSTMIREKINNKEDVTKYLDKKVIDYIKTYNLYNYKKYKNEEEFLKDYDSSIYPRFAVATDILVFGVSSTECDDYRKLDSKKMSILLIKRDDYPYKDKWCLPGGFVGIDEDIEDAPKRVLKNETGLENIYLEQLYTFGGVNRDPRMRVVTSAYMSLIDKDRIDRELKNRSDWFDIVDVIYNKNKVLVKLSNGLENIEFELDKKIKEETTNSYEYKITKNDDLSFDNPLVIITGIERLKNKLSYTDIVFNMMPKYFTLGELQKVYEVILGKKLLDPAFRREIKDKVVETDLYKTGEGHRPSKLFMYKK